MRRPGYGCAVCLVLEANSFGPPVRGSHEFECGLARHCNSCGSRLDFCLIEIFRKLYQPYFEPIHLKIYVFSPVSSPNMG